MAAGEKLKRNLVIPEFPLFYPLFLIPGVVGAVACCARVATGVAIHSPATDDCKVSGTELCLWRHFFHPYSVSDSIPQGQIVSLSLCLDKKLGTTAYSPAQHAFTYRSKYGNTVTVVALPYCRTKCAFVSGIQTLTKSSFSIISYLKPKNKKMSIRRQIISSASK